MNSAQIQSQNPLDFNNAITGVQKYGNSQTPQKTLFKEMNFEKNGIWPQEGSLVYSKNHGKMNMTSTSNGMYQHKFVNGPKNPMNSNQFGQPYTHFQSLQPFDPKKFNQNDTMVVG